MFDKYVQLAKRHGGEALLKLVLVGALQNGFFYLLALVQVSWGFASWQTFALNYPLAVLVTFVANRGWVFAGRAKAHGQIVRYVIVYVAVYFFAMACSEGLERLGFPPGLAILLTMAPAAVALFLALNLWVFPSEKGPPDPPVERNA